MACGTARSKPIGGTRGVRSRGFERAEQPGRLLRARSRLHAVVRQGGEVVPVGGGAELAYASSNLGYCYWRGHGVGMDLGAALAWFERALEQGDDRAKEMVERLERDLGVVLSTGMSRGPQPANVAACPGGHAVDPSVEARSRLLPRDGPPGQLRHLHVAPVGSTRETCGREPPTLEHPSGPSVERGQQMSDRSARQTADPACGSDAGRNELRAGWRGRCAAPTHGEWRR